MLASVRRRLSPDEAAQRAASGQRPAYDADGRPALVVRWFRIERVFRYDNTTGEPLSEAPEFVQVTGDTPPGGWDALAALVTGHGFTLTAEPKQGDTRGHTKYTQRTVNVDPRYPLAERVHVLVHELGHIRCDHETRRAVSRAQRETEAESVAFIVSTALEPARRRSASAVYVAAGRTATPRPSPPRRPPSTRPPGRARKSGQPASRRGRGHAPALVEEVS